MQPITVIPLIAVMLIDAVVIAYVARGALRTQSGFFLIVNALALVFLSGSGTLVRAYGTVTPATLSLPFFASLIVPANLLYFAMTRPKPMRASWDGVTPLILIFFPAVALTAYMVYLGETQSPFDYRIFVNLSEIPLNRPISRAAVVYSLICLVGAVAMFSIRYSSTEGIEHVVAKHLIVVIVGPIFFGAMYWVAAEGATYIPSPTVLFALMAQVSLIAVLRQEELSNPRLLSRVVYYTTAVLVAFLLAVLMTEIYTLQVGRFVLDRTVGWVVLVASLLLILATRFSRVESKLDQLLFKRAAEYRRVVEETQAELKSARERLRQSERLSVVGELAARVAHEIKNPLGPIKGYAQMMREKIEADPEYKHRETFLRQLSVITEEAENIDKRIGDFLATARQPELLIEEVSPNRLAERCVRLLRLEIASGVESLSDKRITVQIFPEIDLGVIHGDHGRLEECFFNLSRNALDAVSNEKEARIVFYTRSETRMGRDGIVFEVEDNGPGFDEKNVENYFESFYTEKKKGTGLGLSIVKSIVNAHGGEVVLTNRKESGGKVTLWLPRESTPNPGALLPKANSRFVGEKTN